MSSSKLTKWEEKILQIFAEQLAFRGRLASVKDNVSPVLVKAEEDYLEKGGKEGVPQGVDDGSSLDLERYSAIATTVSDEALSLRILVSEIEKWCEYKAKTPFYRSVVKRSSLLKVCGSSSNGLSASLSAAGVRTILTHPSIKVPKFRTSNDIYQYLLKQKISRGNQMTLFNYLWHDGNYKTYQQLADHLNLFRDDESKYDPTDANFKTTIRGIRRKTDIFEHKFLRGTGGTDVIRVMQHFYHIEGPPSSPLLEESQTQVKQEEYPLKLHSNQTTRSGAGDDDSRHSSSDKTNRAVKQEKKRTPTPREQQEEYHRKRQQQCEASRKKQRTDGELTLDDIRPVNSNAWNVAAISMKSSSSSSSRQLAYTNRVKSNLNNDEKELLDEFERFLCITDKKIHKKPLSPDNRKRIMSQTIKLLSGDGIDYHRWSKAFLKGQKIDFLNSNFQYYEDLRIQAKKWEDRYGKDLGNGWLATHSLRYLSRFKKYKATTLAETAKQAAFKETSFAPSLSSASAPSGSVLSGDINRSSITQQQKLANGPSSPLSKSLSMSMAGSMVEISTGTTSSLSQKKKLSQMEMFFHHRYHRSIQQQAKAVIVKAEPKDDN